MRRARPPAAGSRRGVALVAALGLLMLAAALLAGSVAASTELARSTRSLASAARAESEASRAVGLMIQEWNARADSLPIGGVIDRVVVDAAPGGPPLKVSTRVRRVAGSLFAASITVRVGTDAPTLAQRRLRLLLRRGTPPADTALPPPVVPLSRWSVVSLH